MLTYLTHFWQFLWLDISPISPEKSSFLVKSLLSNNYRIFLQRCYDNQDLDTS